MGAVRFGMIGALILLWDFERYCMLWDEEAGGEYRISMDGESRSMHDILWGKPEGDLPWTDGQNDVAFAS